MVNSFELFDWSERNAKMTKAELMLKPVDLRGKVTALNPPSHNFALKVLLKGGGSRIFS